MRRPPRYGTGEGPAILQTLAALGEAQAWLAEVPVDRVVEGLAEAAEALRSALEGPLPQTLQQQAGLSEPMIRWATRSTLSTFGMPALARLAQTHDPARCQATPGLCAVVLSGNVFTAPLRALTLPLLARRAVIAKTPVGQDALARAFVQKLQAVDPSLGQCVAVHAFARTDTGATDALLSQVSVVSAYGDDDSLAELQGRLPEGVPLIAHGHGLGALFASQAALANRGRDGLLARVALDVAAYDQRGCLSPQHLFIESGPLQAREVAHELHAALGSVEKRLPRAAVADAERGACVQWRGVAAACGQLFEAPTHAVSVESEPRTGPGLRHVAVIPVDGTQGLLRVLAPWGDHLKTLALDDQTRARQMMAALAEQDQHPQLARIGEIQTPPLHALTDGRPPMDGL